MIRYACKRAYQLHFIERKLVTNEVRFFGSNDAKINENNPFEVLGIHPSATYQEVKRRFVELALKHHPDLSDSGKTEDFVRFRQAFESIQEGDNGNARTTGGNASGWSDEEFQAWFYEETGHEDILFRMDLKTRKEVIDVANEQAQGGLDRGGMWQMAREMAEREQDLGKKKGRFSGSIGIDSCSAQGQPATSPRRRQRR